MIGAVIGEHFNTLDIEAQGFAIMVIASALLGLLYRRINSWAASMIWDLKRKAWDQLPEVGSGDPADLARYIMINHVCNILGINDVKKPKRR